MDLDDLLKEQEGRTSTVPVPVQSASTAAPGVVSVDDILDAGPYCYISGMAGTGKTYLARQLAQREDTLLCATTGIAAVNLGDAVTINATLGYFDAASLREALVEGRLQARLRALIRSGIRRLVVDEISMMEADVLTDLVTGLEEVAKTATYDQDLGEVVQQERDDRRMALVLVGDFGQLPPIKAPFAFESPEWVRFEEKTFRLEKIWRQGDQAFVEALKAIRKGDPRPALPVLRGRFTTKLNLKDFDGTTIVSKNDEVDRINTIRHADLPGVPIIWKTIRSGEQQKDWTRLIPNETAIKPGALVMILANGYDRETHELRYANGDLATLVGLSHPVAPKDLEGLDEADKHDLLDDGEIPGIKVMLHRTFQEVVVRPVTREWLEPYHETEAEKAQRELEEKRIGRKIRKPKYRTKGSISYMPLRLAYATTVHKSQGLSLDKVQIGLSGWMFNQPGMTYVALSRCRSLEGLTIVGTEQLLLGRCSVDPKVRGWI